LPPTGAYLLDSYALLAYFASEPGSEQVVKLLEVAAAGNCRLYLCIVNLGEIMYIVERERGLQKAQETLARIDELPIEVINVDRPLSLAAAHLKALSPIAYADCFAAALAQLKNASLVTGDPEFHKIKSNSNLRIEWLAAA
jgi:predicted nucleic acid-binding protein